MNDILLVIITNDHLANAPEDNRYDPSETSKNGPSEDNTEKMQKKQATEN